MSVCQYDDVALLAESHWATAYQQRADLRSKCIIACLAAVAMSVHTNAGRLLGSSCDCLMFRRRTLSKHCLSIISQHDHSIICAKTKFAPQARCADARVVGWWYYRSERQGQIGAHCFVCYSARFCVATLHASSLLAACIGSQLGVLPVVIKCLSSRWQLTQPGMVHQQAARRARLAI
jgi:hypothetical protein